MCHSIVVLLPATLSDPNAVNKRGIAMETKDRFVS